MRWTLGLLLIASAGCGYRQTKMVACPETGCTQNYASASPEGLPGPGERAREERVAPLPPPTPIAPPLQPLPDTEPPPPAPPVYTPSSP